MRITGVGEDVKEGRSKKEKGGVREGWKERKGEDVKERRKKDSVVESRSGKGGKEMRGCVGEGKK